MKNFLNIIYVGILIFVLSSCDIGSFPTFVDEISSEQLAIIIITPELQQQVLVSPIVDSIITNNNSYYKYTLSYGDGLVLCNPTRSDSIYSDFIQSQFKLLGTNPYILLGYGYAIIDWKWRHFHPLFGATRQSKAYDAPREEYSRNYLPVYNTNGHYLNGAIANEEYYLLSMQWTEISDFNTIWAMEEGRIIEKPEIQYINCTEIEKFGDFTTSIRDIRIKYGLYIYDDVLAEYTLYSQDSVMYSNFVAEMDKLQSMYIETLDQMIKNKCFRR